MDLQSRLVCCYDPLEGGSPTGNQHHDLLDRIISWLVDEYASQPGLIESQRCRASDFQIGKLSKAAQAIAVY